MFLKMNEKYRRGEEESECGRKREGYRRMVETWKCDKKKQCHTLEGERRSQNKIGKLNNK